MRQGLRKAGLITLVILMGCGNNPPKPKSVGFVNETWHAEADLVEIWQTAQQSVTKEINLNPVEQSIENAPPRILPGDSRALQILPRQLTVKAEPDVTAQALLAATGAERTDPTGLIPCPQPCDVRYATAYSRYHPEITRYAASWESTENNFRAILEYEFENQILFSLGYDMKWR